MIKRLWKLYASQSYFFKVTLVVLLLLLIITPFFVNNRQIYQPRAATLPIETPANAIPPTVFAFYYDWYGAPPYDSTYGHWDGGGGFAAPNDIEADFYPQLGAYSSKDLAVLDQHMKWMKQAGIDVVVLSWWGQGDYTDKNVAGVLNAATQNGMKVSFMIEPYANRTVQSIVSDIQYIYAHYGNSPAFYRVSRPTEFGPSTALRGIFFVYALDGGDATVQAFDAIRGTSYDAIVLARMADSMIFDDTSIRTQLSYSHVDGFFNYSQFAPPTGPWARSNDYMIVVSALPGWDHSRLPGQSTNLQSRLNGQYYDNDWQTLINQKVEGVSIISFNEWHEGGQIEPAVPHTYTTASGSAIVYQSYEGAYSLTGDAASMAYINRTAYWVNQYKAQATVSVTPTPPSVSITPLLTDTPTPSPSAFIRGDLNDTGKVDALDLSLLLSAWGTTDDTINQELGRTSGSKINALALSALLSDWTP